MKVQLKLADDGPPFWFLGEPRDIRVSLTMTDPGPIEVDFDALADVERTKIMADLQRGIVESDVPFPTLHEVCLRLQAPPPPSVEAEAHLAQQQRYEAAQKALKQQVAKEKKVKKFNERVDYLSKLGVRAVRAALQDESDIRLLRAIREKEALKKRPRKSLMNFIEDKIKRIQLSVVEDIEKKQNLNAKPLKLDSMDAKSKTFLSDVVESEGEVVQFSNEDLERLASGDEF